MVAGWSPRCRVNLSDLNRKLELIMSAISDFVAKQKAFNDRQGAAIDAAVQSLSGITGDIQTLNDKITQLQNNPGPISPEDQGLLDEALTIGSSLADKAESLSQALATLDAQTPPPAPPGA